MTQQTSTVAQPTAQSDRGLVKLSEHQTSTAAAILARSFVDDPMFDFIFPQWDTRLQALTDWSGARSPRTGSGGQLLQPAIAAAVAQQVGSYLVSSNHRNLSFYQRHGLQKTAAIAISPTYAMTGMGRRLDQSSLAT